MVWLCGLSMFVCLLATTGTGLADGFALAQRNVASPLETIAAEIPITAAEFFLPLAPWRKSGWPDPRRGLLRDKSAAG